ncbi:MAG TPA: ABC transporter substrate-binding protein, partial [Ktedonobacteraceae bacterium]|nr:ABC transporter substrate-binding protein [Ktedonobacteraceae bacterium]
TNAPMKERDVLVHATELLDALDYLSRQTPPIVHRDIKPANVIIGAKDRRAHLVDFGIARADVARNARRKQTTALGTPGYAPPEQYQGNADPRSDLYALGATLHHLLTNRDPRNFPPFTFPPVRTLNPQLSPAVEQLLTRALHNDINQRYQSAAAMKHDVEEILYNRFGISSGALGIHSTSGNMNAVNPNQPASSFANAPTVSAPPISQVPAPNPQTPLPTGSHGMAPYPGMYAPVQQAPQQRHTGRNILLILLLLVLLGGGAFAAFNLLRRGGTATGNNPGIVNGIGVTKAKTGESIGISDGTFAFDTSRPDGSLKQQASAALKEGNTSQAQGLWQQALSQETNDAEALIYMENQRVLSGGGLHVTIVVATMLTGTDSGVGRDDLQGAYVAQKTYNDGALLNGIGVVLLIANAGSDASNATAVAQQIVQAAKADSSIIGVMGWPFSGYVASTVNIFKDAHLPLISQTASSDLFTGISPYFFRVCASNKAQGLAAAAYMKDKLQAKNIIVFTDPLNSYTSSLTNDFTNQFTADGGTILATEKYTVGKAATISAALQDALKYTSPVPDMLYFAGYASDISTLMVGLPTTGDWGKVQIMGGDALYELSGYQSSAQINWNRLHFTSFTFPDAWDVLGLSSQKPAFFTNYRTAFDPKHTQPVGKYGFGRPDNDVILSYDAVVTMLVAAKETGKSQMTGEDIQKALTQLTGAKAFQGVSGQISLGANGDPVNKAVVILNVSQQGFIHMDKTIEGQFLLGK